MKLSVLKPFLFLTLLLIKLTGCGKLIDWGKSHFEQGDTRTVEKGAVLAHVRSVKVYDQVTTVGIFDALWLSDEVRTLYTDVHCQRLGKSAEEKDEFLRRQLAENEHDLSFYILSYVPGETSLNEKDSSWSVFLDIDGHLYEPRSIMTVDLTPTYKLLLNKYVSRYKTVYLVKFSIKDPDDSYRYTPETQQLKLVFNTTDRSAVMCWDIKEGKLVEKKKE